MQTGRGLCAAGLGWVAGIALQLQQRELWPIAVYQALAVAGLPLVPLLMLQAWWPRSRRAEQGGGRLPPGLCLLAAAALALGSTGWRAADRLGDALDADLEGRDIEVVGVVASLPQFRVDGVRFLFEVESARLDGEPVALPPLVSLGWYAQERGASIAGQPQSRVEAGQRWRFALRLRQPHGNLNPHGFDYELWLFEQDVRATGYVRAGKGAA